MADLQKLELKITAALKEFVETKEASSKVVSDLSSVINATSELPLVNLEYWEMFIRERYDNALTSDYSSKWAFWQSNAPRITLLDLCNWDGYRREKALRAIGEKVPNRFFLALVLRRLNDWVPQVRQAAQDILSKVLANYYKKQLNRGDRYARVYSLIELGCYSDAELAIKQLNALRKLFHEEYIQEKIDSILYIGFKALCSDLDEPEFQVSYFLNYDLN